MKDKSISTTASTITALNSLNWIKKHCVFKDEMSRAYLSLENMCDGIEEVIKRLSKEEFDDTPIEEQIVPKCCPICGSNPLFDKESMDEGNGHGYPGDYNYSYYCTVCGIPKKQSGCTVGFSGIDTDKHREARKIAIINWNKEVDRIEGYLARKKHIYFSNKGGERK